MNTQDLKQSDIDYMIHGYVDLSRYQQSGGRIINKGQGIYIYDDAGTPYIEAVAGMWCASLGFGNTELAEAATEQLHRLPYYHTLAYKSVTPAVQLAEKLASMMPMEKAHIYYGVSGSEANDFQVKALRYYNNARGQVQKKKFIGRQSGFHGVSLAAGSLTGMPAMHRDFDLPLPGFFHVSEPNYYRYGLPGESEEAYTDRLILEIATLIEREGPETIAAFIAEPVMGAGGVIFPPKGYFAKLQALLSAHDIALIADEVITGFYRTGTLWGSQSQGLSPNTLSCAKGLTSAYQPLSAVAIQDDIYQTMVEGSRASGFFGHGTTYAGHPVACAVALKVIEIMERDKIAENVARSGARLAARLSALEGLPFIGHSRSLGLMGAVEFRADPATKQDFGQTGVFARRLAQIAEERHQLVVRPLNGRDICAFAPPLIITPEEIDETFDRFERALKDVTDEITRGELDLV